MPVRRSTSVIRARSGQGGSNESTDGLLVGSVVVEVAVFVPDDGDPGA